MFGFTTGVATKKLTPAIIAEWKRRYGEKLCFEEFEGLVAYIRLPTDKEVKKVIKGQQKHLDFLDEVAYIKSVIKIGWLGGDISLLTNERFINKIQSIWLT